ncbi:CopG family ribbon-helix-helix protein [Pseudidiomarina donghaiensis]|uniref:Ribbon-helix-helix protein, CopG family n=1 Tax=Pseudidiomarina donghaiensis TaxID=519452 RepID=A0A432XIF1_9GAMM|nr:ribbon-helix-helix protein, CopG family [Pseudidiomarina donghaiensis]RUO48508.1 ribbon-helix-helix protein, CopG family [Pseudidiomarina donghaiensis]SFV23865.1 Predicted transcriptional regulator [Pseudidiomarina donghaiensis]
MSVTTVRLQDDIERELQAIADKLSRSKGWVIKQALAEYIEKQKLEQQRWHETLQAMESAVTGKVVDGDTVHEWLASWGTEQEHVKKGQLE